MNVELHIERLVVEGIDVPPGERDLLHETVRTELARLLASTGVSPELTGLGLGEKYSSHDRGSP